MRAVESRSHGRTGTARAGKPELSLDRRRSCRVRRGWDFGDAVVWVQLQPIYGDKPYCSTRVYAEINGIWQMAESYHTYIKDAPVMAPVPVSATSMTAN